MEYLTIGELESAVYTEDGMLKVVGTYGEVSFYVLSAASRCRLELPDGRILREPRLDAWIRLNESRLTGWDNGLTVGEEVSLPSMTEALEALRARARMLAAEGYRTSEDDEVGWVKPNGDRCEGPAWYNEDGFVA